MSATATRAAYDPRAACLRTFHDAVAGFRSGVDTPSAYLERCAEVILRREPEVRAFAALALDSARTAAAAATARYAAGHALSPIDGLPVAVKDIFETRDMPTAWGAEGLGYRPWRDAAVVRALRAGGAVLVGKTRLPELGFGTPAITANPWDTSRSPGGSSSGSAAAVGAAMVPCAIGTQGRGSLTRPASYCGVYGYKPTHGAIHRGGDGGGQETNTHVGTLAGSLADAWIVARYLSDEAGPHPGSFGIEGPPTLPAALKPKRLVRLEGPGWTQTGEAVKRAYESLLEGIARAGVPVIAADDLPETAMLESMLAEAGAALADIADYESRWPLVMYLAEAREEGASALSQTVFERGLRAPEFRAMPTTPPFAPVPRTRKRSSRAQRTALPSSRRPRQTPRQIPRAPARRSTSSPPRSPETRLSVFR